MESELVDKLGQKIEVGLWVIKPWDGSFDFGKVTKVGNGWFDYEYEHTGFDHNKRMFSSKCKVPKRCLIVPEIVANYWTILQ